MSDLMVRYADDEEFRARITEMYLRERPKFIARVIQFAVSQGCGRREAVEFAGAVIERVKAGLADQK